MNTSVQVAQFVLNILLAIFTLSLFIQGQVDRRRVAADKKREQASKVGIYRQEIYDPTAPEAKRHRTRVEIRNDSDSIISEVRAEHFSRRSWNQSIPTWRALLEAYPHGQRISFTSQSINSENPHPPGVSIPPGEKIHYEGKPLEGTSIEVFFVDGAGKGWMRSNGELWYFTPEGCPMTLLGRTYTFSQRNWQVILLGLPLLYADWRFRSTMPRVPLSARVARFIYGSAATPCGTPMPWTQPRNFFPSRDWPYQSWIGDLEFRSQKGQLPIERPWWDLRSF